MNRTVRVERIPWRACRSRRSILAATVLAVVGGGVAGARQAPSPLVLAAASLKDAIEAAGAEFARTSGVRPRYAFAATSALARQLEQGIDAELFLSADLQWMDYAVRRGLVDPASVYPLLGNRLVLVAPRGEARPIDLVQGVDLLRMLRKGRLALADVRAVPAGRYAKAALESLGAWGGVADSLAMTETVRAALALAARGEVPLAIVYQTDARVEPRVTVVGTFPQHSHPPIRYPVALVRGGRSAAAIAFHAFLRAASAARIFADHGFVILV